jgi:hypothetical protein
MNFPPAVVVHGLRHARAALAPGLPVTLLSARGAAIYAGCGWWHAMMQVVGAEIDILDCADAPGYAMAALRLGQRRIILDAGPAFAAVSAAAATLGAIVLDTRPAALDLADRGAERRLLGWLEGDKPERLG